MKPKDFARKFIVAVAALALLIGGVALLVLPGPGLLLIFLAIILLAQEFKSADRLKTWLLQNWQAFRRHHHGPDDKS